MEINQQTIEDSKDQGIYIEEIQKKQEHTTEESVPPFYKLLLYSLNDKLKSILTFVKGFWFTPIGRVSILFIILLIAAIPIVLIILGFDNIIIRSSISGKIYTLDNVPVSGAQIIIQGKSATADENGQFKVEDLNYGKWEIVIKANGYSDYKEQIVLNRFGNKFDFEIMPLDYGVVNGSFISPEIVLDQMEVSINDQRIEVNTAGGFETGRLIVGTYKLKFSSPYYKDFEQDIEVQSGVHIVGPFSLEQTGDLIWSVNDFVSNAKIDDADIEVTPETYSIDEIEKGYLIKDIPLKQKMIIKVEHEGYKDLEIEKEIVQGENSIGNIGLVKLGSMIRYKNGYVEKSDIDGDNSFILSNGLTGCKVLTINVASTYLSCMGEIFDVSNDTGDFSLVDSYAGDLSGYIPGIGEIKVDNNPTELKLINDEGENILFTSEDEEIISWIADRNQECVYFSTDYAIYKVTLSGDQDAEIVTLGIFYLQDISYSNDKIVALNIATSNGSTNNIWVINVNGEKYRLTSFPDYFQQVKYINDNRIVYIKEKGSSSSLYFRDLSSNSELLVVEGVDQYILNSNQQIISSSQGSVVYVADYDGNPKKLDK